jgi:uncharacterized Zn finger protein (UPF0148 family)
MADEKDRFGDKIRDVEAAREDQWARQRDAELIEKLKQKGKTALMCPRCNRPLVEHKEGEIEFLACPSGEGAWIAIADLKALLKPHK